MSAYVIARADDWEGLYIDGRLKDEGHSLDLVRILKMTIDLPPSSVDTRMVDLAWMHDSGNLPANLDAVVWEVKP